MDNNNISERLKALAKGENRSATARLRDVFNDIEAALKAGARRKDVHHELQKSGFDISFASFELAIYRIRKEIVNQQKISPTNLSTPAPAIQATTTNPLHALTGKPKNGDHNPIPTAKFEIDKS